jgi:hypothetical protein
MGGGSSDVIELAFVERAFDDFATGVMGDAPHRPKANSTWVYDLDSRL